MEIFTFLRVGGALDRIEVDLITNPGQDRRQARRELRAQLATFDAAKAQCFKKEDKRRSVA